MSFDYSYLKFSQPASQVKTINVEPIPQRIFSGMKDYEDAARGFTLFGFERSVETADGQKTPDHLLVSHRPADAQVEQIYRVPTDTQSTDLQRLTHFDIGIGRNIFDFFPIKGDDWRGVWRGGGALMVMDFDGSEEYQLWRYWEDAYSAHTLPKIEGELDNHPGTGRIERLTHDGFRYNNLIISQSDRIMAFSSNKENKTDTLIYIMDLIGSKTGANADAAPFHLPSKLITPTTGQGTSRWVVESISVDDRYILLTKQNSSAYRPLYIVDISGPGPYAPDLITLPQSTEKEDETAYTRSLFSRDPSKASSIFMITNAYGDYNAVIMYDIETGSVTHVTSPEPHLYALRPISWEISSIEVTRDRIFFCANVEGWSKLYMMPLSDAHKDTVIEVQLEWEGGGISFTTNALNEKPGELALKLVSHRSRGFVARLDIASSLEHVQRDEQGNAYISTSFSEYSQAAAALLKFRTLPPKLIKFKSFDGLEIPAMYYHPSEEQSVAPVVIGIHGGPESQATAQHRVPIHGYLLNELGCAVIYPNVRGSSGYGKKYMAADDVEKREDSVKDIGALLDHVDKNMKWLDSKRIAVMGGSYGGYMVFASLIHFSSKLTCGVANFGIAHWPSFLQNTAAVRRAARRREYGDETIPEIREFLERISPLNNASKITVPLSIAHGDKDSRVTVEEAIRMWEIVSENVHAELMVCEQEGHGALSSAACATN
ncbi:hypothetical protein SERLA73DRAFT_72051 [Serpula lacrymans var. lacrymans S7.3]|uniref:Dipeptidyl-peptidase V n=2 Tax=Serpula lacrymans var. lacrymans TaxID=341189 RepID=F8PTT6_SERL3|nr:uncharacterized protein SERLADRAFT_436559 [Serpula lacrymans var. lacrymans S7.9]EGO01081.1 hypothetical protein SERLA73DRAFT_72051 [Serpula lacrymans var. lacrymans S7.3]EGO26739.1 hypothetical protein SERLADRAFT_436559 [Serpula lacrymans var. lacrymans S7.9]